MWAATKRCGPLPGLSAAASPPAPAGGPPSPCTPIPPPGPAPRCAQTYQKLLTTDFLEHRGLYAAVQACLRAHAAAAARPLALLDLGCGDAQQMAALLRACGCDSPHSPQGPLRLASYTGVDLSTPALALARANLAFLGAAAQLAVQDMQAFLAACPPRSYDLVFASFAVHHLRCAALRCAGRLVPPPRRVLCSPRRRLGVRQQLWPSKRAAGEGTDPTVAVQPPPGALPACAVASRRP